MRCAIGPARIKNLTERVRISRAGTGLSCQRVMSGCSSSAGTHKVRTSHQTVRPCRCPYKPAGRARQRCLDSSGLGPGACGGSDRGGCISGRVCESGCRVGSEGEFRRTVGFFPRTSGGSGGGVGSGICSTLVFNVAIAAAVSPAETTRDFRIAAVRTAKRSSRLAERMLFKCFGAARLPLLHGRIGQLNALRHSPRRARTFSYRPSLPPDAPCADMPFH